MDILEKVTVYGQNAIKIERKKTVYIDPYNLPDTVERDADYIFCTHSHYDHFSPKDIKKIIKPDTYLIVPNTMADELKTLVDDESKVICVKPDTNYEIQGFHFRTTPAYNTFKPFHPKKNAWVGYILLIDDLTYYIVGDSDNISPLEEVSCDVIFIPVGGTYTMTYKEAAKLVNKIKPQIAVPTHYGSIVGKKTDGLEFIKLLQEPIKGEQMIKFDN